MRKLQSLKLESSKLEVFEVIRQLNDFISGKGVKADVEKFDNCFNIYTRQYLDDDTPELKANQLLAAFKSLGVSEEADIVVTEYGFKIVMGPDSQNVKLMEQYKTESFDFYDCCICEDTFRGWGNNPWPIDNNPDARACPECNTKYVLPARLKGLRKESKLNEADGREDIEHKASNTILDKRFTWVFSVLNEDGTYIEESIGNLQDAIDTLETKHGTFLVAFPYIDPKPGDDSVKLVFADNPGPITLYNREEATIPKPDIPTPTEVEAVQVEEDTDTINEYGMATDKTRAIDIYATPLADRYRDHTYYDFEAWGESELIQLILDLVEESQYKNESTDIDEDQEVIEEGLVEDEDFGDDDDGELVCSSCGTDSIDTDTGWCSDCRAFSEPIPYADYKQYYESVEQDTVQDIVQEEIQDIVQEDIIAETDDNEQKNGFIHNTQLVLRVIQDTIKELGVPEAEARELVVAAIMTDEVSGQVSDGEFEDMGHGQAYYIMEFPDYDGGMDYPHDYDYELDWSRVNDEIDRKYEDAVDADVVAIFRKYRDDLYFGGNFCESLLDEFPDDQMWLFGTMQDNLENVKQICRSCGDECGPDSGQSSDDDDLCHSCYRDVYQTCSSCGAETEYEGDEYCRDCERMYNDEEELDEAKKAEPKTKAVEEYFISLQFKEAFIESNVPDDTEDVLEVYREHLSNIKKQAKTELNKLVRFYYENDDEADYVSDLITEAEAKTLMSYFDLKQVTVKINKMEV